MKKYKYDTSFSYKGRKYNIRANSQKELSEKRLAKMREIDEQKAKESRTTVSEWTEKCIELYKVGQSEITRDKYIKRIRHCILEHIGTIPIKDVKPFQIQEVLNLQAGKSKTQVNEVYHALKFIFDKAVANDLISKDPTRSLAKPIYTVNHRRALTPEEREVFLRVATSERKYYGFLLMLYCGCRPGEAMSCIGEDMQVIDGVNVLHIRGTKTALSDRFVPIPDELYQLIKNTPKSENIALYPSGKPVTYDNRHHVWHGLWYKMNIEAGSPSYRNALIEPYKIPKNLSPYCLRHEYCSDLARRGVDIRIAQRLMGHSTINLTANIYTHIENADLIKASAAVLSTPKVTHPTV